MTGKRFKFCMDIETKAKTPIMDNYIRMDIGEVLNELNQLDEKNNHLITLLKNYKEENEELKEENKELHKLNQEYVDSWSDEKKQTISEISNLIWSDYE